MDLTQGKPGIFILMMHLMKKRKVVLTFQFILCDGDGASPVHFDHYSEGKAGEAVGGMRGRGKWGKEKSFWQ